MFALVHGAWHGGWCFAPLARELEARGHRVVAPDLPCDDVRAGLDEYAAVVEAALGDEDDVVLVGHSLGGITVPLVAARRPVRRLVYLCAVIPRPGEPFGRYAGEALAPGAPAVERDEQGRSYWADLDLAVAQLYGDCDPGVAHAAAARLRPQAATPQREPCPLDRLPDVPTAYVLCRRDAAVDPAWSRRAAPELLGIEAIELDGDHSPMLSRPRELAGLLARLSGD